MWQLAGITGACFVRWSLAVCKVPVAIILTRRQRRDLCHLRIKLPAFNHSRCKLHTVLLYCWTLSREAVDTNLSSVWFKPTGNRAQVFRFSSRRSIYSIIDRYLVTNSIFLSAGCGNAANEFQCWRRIAGTSLCQSKLHPEDRWRHALHAGVRTARWRHEVRDGRIQLLQTLRKPRGLFCFFFVETHLVILQIALVSYCPAFLPTGAWRNSADPHETHPRVLLKVKNLEKNFGYIHRFKCRKPRWLLLCACKIEYYVGIPPMKAESFWSVHQSAVVKKFQLAG